MLNITIPMWLLLTIAGLPNLMLLALVVRLMRLRKRKKNQMTAQAQPVAPAAFQGFDDQVHQQIITQQIDAVFNALFAIIETERIKLKALVTHTYDQESSSTPLPVAPELKDPAETRTVVEKPVQPSRDRQMARPTVASLAEDGLTPDEIAEHLGYSKAEVALALKMNAARNGQVGRKMRAVA